MSPEHRPISLIKLADRQKSLFIYRGGGGAFLIACGELDSVHAIEVCLDVTHNLVARTAGCLRYEGFAAKGIGSPGSFQRS